MLVLSRKKNDKILFPNLGISVEVVKIGGQSVRLGIEAPAHVAVKRHELTDEPHPKRKPPQIELLSERIKEHVAAATAELQALHQQMQGGASSAAEPAMHRILQELEAMDDEVAACHQSVNVPAESLLARRALLVEDNRNEAELLASYLRCRNFDVETASNGAGAMHYLSHHKVPDCVLLDMNMPRYDGKWTIGEIRNNPKYANLKVFAVSGIHPGEYGVEIGPNGINRWFRKPLNPEALVHEMAKAAEGHAQLSA